MVNTAVVLFPDGRTQELDRKPTYEEARKIIGGGYVEIAHGNDHIGRFQMLVDEDGHQKGLPFNGNATRIYRASPIVGVAILMRGWKWS